MRSPNSGLNVNGLEVINNHVILVLTGVMRPISTSCQDHMGSTWARIETWDGAKWNIAPDWYEADEQIIKPMVKAGAEKYLADKKMQRRTVADCQS